MHRQDKRKNNLYTNINIFIHWLTFSCGRLWGNGHCNGRQAGGQPQEALAHVHVTNVHLLDAAFICYRVESPGWVGEADAWRKEGWKMDRRDRAEHHLQERQKLLMQLKTEELQIWQTDMNFGKTLLIIRAECKTNKKKSSFITFDLTY